MSKEEAMKKYVEVVCRVDPGWETAPLDPAAQQVAAHTLLLTHNVSIFGWSLVQYYNIILAEFALTCTL